MPVFGTRGRLVPHRAGWDFSSPENFFVPTAHGNFLPQSPGFQKSKTICFFEIPFKSHLHNTTNKKVARKVPLFCLCAVDGI